jgi:NAD-dependent dihydropyrimidine dehydrogenase PreA subunit
MKKDINKIRTKYIWANHQNCVACWTCIDSCHKNVIGKVMFLWHKHIIIKNRDHCIGCQKCIKICPQGVFSENPPDLLKIVLSKHGIRYV